MNRDGTADAEVPYPRRPGKSAASASSERWLSPYSARPRTLCAHCAFSIASVFSSHHHAFPAAIRFHRVRRAYSCTRANSQPSSRRACHDARRRRPQIRPSRCSSVKIRRRHRLGGGATWRRSSTGTAPVPLRRPAARFQLGGEIGSTAIADKPAKWRLAFAPDTGQVRGRPNDHSGWLRIDQLGAVP